MNLTLRQVLFGPYVALLAATALGIGALSYKAGSNAVENLAGRYINETAGRINLSVAGLLTHSDAALEAAFPTGLSTPVALEQGLDELRERLFIASNIRPDPNHYVYFGNERGQFIGVNQLGGKRTEVRLKVDPAAERTIHRDVQGLGPLGAGEREANFYDPRQRPWYQQALQAQGQPVWTPVYVNFRDRELIATRARAVRGPQGELAGVVATDVSLAELARFLRTLRISDGGVAAVLEPDGRLLGASSGSFLRAMAAGDVQRLSASESDNPLIQAAYAAARPLFGTLDEAGAPRLVNFRDAQGRSLYAAVSRVGANRGLDWLSLVALPREDVMEAIPQTLRRSLLVSVLAALASIGLGWWVLNWIARDLRTISDGARRIGLGELDVPMDMKRRDEIGQLAHSFTTMQRQLRTDPLTSLYNRESFRRRLRERSERAARLGKRPGFAVIFVDLDRFKLVNDALGHGAGDAVLIEVAERMRACFLPQDTVARLGGDEFAVLMDEASDGEHVTAVMGSLSLSIARRFERVNHDALEATGFGISMGYAHFPLDGDDLDELLDVADRRMYNAKFVTRRHRAGHTRV